VCSLQLVNARDAAGGDGELERIQELFPNDNLRLHDPHPTAQVCRGFPLLMLHLFKSDGQDGVLSDCPVFEKLSVMRARLIIV
jgi:hypothetical protein